MAPVYSLLDLALLRVSESSVLDHHRSRLPFVHARHRVQTLLRFPTKQVLPTENLPWDPIIFLLDLPNGVRMLWFVNLNSSALSWTTFECHHVGPDLTELAYYTHRVKWNKTLEGSNTYTFSIRP